MLMWETLRQLDSKAGTIKPPLASQPAALSLADYDAKTVRIPGYLVPLDYTGKRVVDFLLVPTLPNCIHVPPPGPNQTVHVKMVKGTSVEMNFDPIWVEGKLKIIREKKTGYGEASFELEGRSSGKYEFQGPRHTN